MTSCTCFSPGSGEGCPAAPTGMFPLSGPEGSPGAAPHCSADTACPEPGLTASPQGPARGGAGRLAQRPLPAPPGSPGFPTLQSPLRVCHWGFFQTLHLISSKDAVRSAKPSADGADSHEGPAAPREGASGRGAARACTGAGTAPCGEGAEPPWQGSSWSKPSRDRRAGPRRSRQVPAQPGTPRHTPGHPAAVQQHASPGAAGSRAASYCSGHPPAASAKRQVFAWPVTQP